MLRGSGDDVSAFVVDFGVWKEEEGVEGKRERSNLEEYFCSSNLASDGIMNLEVEVEVEQKAVLVEEADFEVEMEVKTQEDLEATDEVIAVRFEEEIVEVAYVAEGAVESVEGNLDDVVTKEKVEAEMGLELQTQEDLDLQSTNPASLPDPPSVSFSVSTSLPIIIPIQEPQTQELTGSNETGSPKRSSTTLEEQLEVGSQDSVLSQEFKRRKTDGDD